MRHSDRLDRLRERIRELVSAGPIKATEGYAILGAEGYSPAEIDRARRSEVAVRGITRAAQWWRRIPSLTVAKPAPSPSVSPPEEEQRSKARVCVECGKPIGHRKPGEPPLCLRDQARLKTAS